MSAPAGWHLQPDGRERFWDGTQWTEQFRTVEPPPLSDPTAPPPAPSWAQSGSGDAGATGGGDPTAPVEDTTSAATSDQTQALDVSTTQAIPTPPPYGSQPYGGEPYGGQAHPGPSYSGTSSAGAGQQASGPPYAYPPAAGAPTTGYGAPGQPWQGGPPPQRSSGLAKGCLIAGIVGLLVLVLAVVLAIFFVTRTVEEVRDTFPTTIPTDLPSDLPTDLPSGLPTEDLGEQVGVTVGRGFEIPRATIEDGWSLDKQGAGALSVVTIEGMKATLQDQDGFPVLFTISFRPAGGGEPVETVCTAPAGSAGATVDVSCVPLLGDVADARQGTVTTTL